MFRAVRSRRSGRAVEGGGLENRWTRKGLGGSNPSSSAMLSLPAICEGRLFAADGPSLSGFSAPTKSSTYAVVMFSTPGRTPAFGARRVKLEWPDGHFMPASRSTWFIFAAWLLLVGGYATAALLVRPGPGLTTFGDITQCLLALGCSFWMVGQLEWTYVEAYQHQRLPDFFRGDIIFFLHTVPMIAALALRPHARRPGRNLRFGYLDFTLLLLWWLYLYLFVVIPWQYVMPDAAIYGHNYNLLYAMENMVFVIGLGIFALSAKGPWRVVYANLFGAASIYTMSSLLINVAIDQQKYYTGSVYDIPLVASFVWLGTSGVLAYRLCPVAEPEEEKPEEEARWIAGLRLNEGAWASRLALAAVLSLPALAIWSLLASAEAPAVRRFRLVVTLAAIVPLTFLVFLRQHLVDGDRLRLLRTSQESLENLRRLQTQFVQSEKLASLGQLAAGAAHE